MQGLECHGVAEYVVVNGRVVVDECELKAVQGFGKFVSTPVNPSYLYDRVIEHEEVIFYLLVKINIIFNKFAYV